MTGNLSADRAELGRFVRALFCNVDADGYVSLRTFEHQRGAKPVEIRAVQINGEGLEPIVAQATGAANRAAKFERPTVFAPPVCTFRSANRAAETDLANGLCLAIECDDHPTEACGRLIGLLGGVTAIVASGGEWAHPETGELEPRLHVYVRLREPTRTPEDHAQLKRANRLAAALVGSDPSAVPLVHPLRWAGSVHRKGAPKLCRISDLREFEVDLADAVERLEQAARLALEHATGPDADRLRVALDIHEIRASAPPDYDPDATDPDLEALADAIPNADEPRAEWIKVGLAFFAASEGSAAGFNAWDRWSRKSGKSHGGTVAQWAQFAKSPPNRTDKGALVQRARRTDADFRLPSWGPAGQHSRGDEGHWEQPGDAEAKGKADGEKVRPALVWADDIVLDLDRPGVVDGLIPRTGIGVSYGESGSRQDLRRARPRLSRRRRPALARHGRRAGRGDLHRRRKPRERQASGMGVEAPPWVDQLPLVIVQASVDMLNGSTAELVELVARITRTRGRVAMVVVDTLARAMIGNENSPEDMGAFVSACGALREAGDTFVLIVHHCGKNAALGARGHSCLRAATDFEEEIALNEAGEGSIKVTKSRDDCSGRVLGFRLDTFELGLNRKGRMVTTCVVRTADPPPKAPPKAPIGALQRVLVDELRKLARRHPEGVEEGVLKSAFISALHAQRRPRGQATAGAQALHQQVQRNHGIGHSRRARRPARG